MAQAFTRTSCICTAAEKALLASSDLGTGEDNSCVKGTTSKEVGGMMYRRDYRTHELHFKNQILFDVFLMVFLLDVTELAFNP